MTRTRTPALSDIAERAERVAKLCRRNGPAILKMAELLAARGWPTSTLGDGGSRGVGDGLTSTERAADNPGPWADADVQLAAATVTLDRALAAWAVAAGNILAHGDIEATERHNRQPGSGPCMACTRDVPGRENDRLRAGFCGACRKRWERAGRPDRAAFIRRTQADLNPTVVVEGTAVER